MVWSLQTARRPDTRATTPQNARLVSAAHQFEASLMAEVMKPLQEDSLFSEDKDGIPVHWAAAAVYALTGFRLGGTGAMPL